MLPLFARYDHNHYTRSYAQARENATEVHKRFLNGDFVVKESAHHLSQVADDQDLEHYNKPAKIGGHSEGASYEQVEHHIQWIDKYIKLFI